MDRKIILHTETVIEGCHHLKGYDGLCKNVHGHSWRIRFWFRGYKQDCDKVGILVDFSIVKKIKEHLDHKDLNTVVPFNPTAENLVKYLFDYIKKDINKDATKNMIEVTVRLYETSIGKETWAQYGDFDVW